MTARPTVARKRQRRRCGRIAVGGLNEADEADDFAVVVQAEGSVRGVGVVRGQEDDEELLQLPTALLALRGKRVLEVAAGCHHLLVLLRSGEVLSFGDGTDGSLGHSDKEHQPAPKVIEALRGRRVI